MVQSNYRKRNAFIRKNIFTINTSNDHWTCEVANMKEKEIRHHNSTRRNRETHANSLMRHLKHECRDKSNASRNDWSDWK